MNIVHCSHHHPCILLLFAVINRDEYAYSRCYGIVSSCRYVGLCDCIRPTSIRRCAVRVVCTVCQGRTAMRSVSCVWTNRHRTTWQTSFVTQSTRCGTNSSSCESSSMTTNWLVFRVMLACGQLAMAYSASVHILYEWLIFFDVVTDAVCAKSIILYDFLSFALFKSETTLLESWNCLLLFLMYQRL